MGLKHTNPTRPRGPYAFTNIRAVLIDGTPNPAPKVPNGFVAVQYTDQGYQGGTYWAVFPEGWTQESARALFESEGHMTTLVQIG